ncbi:hypothetical protein AQUCO_01600099v1 [Aquilegia coerulea]|uniref:Prolamin-like domain-containing protein n=1 Tax=Aquilegia coerulea TaxID=218851 RepID=A0A2G5DQ52_AQUCA|nr:hypothetical protein AQUCO_01600099v1 [Aquilegia coerulea]
MVIPLLLLLLLFIITEVTSPYLKFKVCVNVTSAKTKWSGRSFLLQIMAPLLAPCLPGPLETICIANTSENICLLFDGLLEKQKGRNYGICIGNHHVLP